MKILYLSDHQADFGAYFLYNGLCQILGDKNIVTYPFKKTYYGQIDNEYILDSGDVGFTAPGDYIVPRETNEWDYEEIVNRISEFALIILSSPRTYAINALRQLIKDFGGDVPCPLVACDHEDGDNLRLDIIEEFRPNLVFKREVIKNNKIPGIFPLPFSGAVNSFPKVDDSIKKYDLFALFGMTWPSRLSVIEKLLEWDYPNSYLGIDSKHIRGDLKEKNKAHIGYKEYLTGIAQSKIALCVRGHGRDTVRHWEIPAYETLMMICDPGIYIPNDFEDGKHAVFFKEDLSDLKDKIDYYLEHDDDRKRIAKAGKEHFLKFHVNEKRAEYFLEIVKNQLNISLK